jgi:hypothetical protein
MMPRCNCGLRLHREPLARDGTGAETLGWNTWPGISQRVDHDTSTVAASPAVPGPRANGRNIAPGSLDLPADPGAAAVISHYEWQYHYAGRHAHWEGQWVLVM